MWRSANCSRLRAYITTLTVANLPLAAKPGFEAASKPELDLRMMHRDHKGRKSVILLILDFLKM